MKIELTATQLLAIVNALRISVESTESNPGPYCREHYVQKRLLARLLKGKP